MSGAIEIAVVGTGPCAGPKTGGHTGPPLQVGHSRVWAALRGGPRNSGVSAGTKAHPLGLDYEM